MAKRKKRNRGGGVPFNPDVDTGTKRPVTARVAVGDVNDKFSDYPSNGLTPRRLARIFREADEGDVYKRQVSRLSTKGSFRLSSVYLVT